MSNIKDSKVLVLDFGSQYTQLITRRIRELRVYTELLPFDVDFEYIKDSKPKKIYRFHFKGNFCPFV